MICGKKVLALIPARGGSKGIKRKNIFPLCGKPLIAYSLEEAVKSRYIDKILVSTDSPEIAEVVKKLGFEVPFLRPKQHAHDESRTIEAVLHSINFLKNREEFYDILVLLQPTSPLRTFEDIDGALERFVATENEGVATVSAVKEHPLLMRLLGVRGNLVHLLDQSSTVRRQDMEPVYKINGCVYVNLIQSLNEETSFGDNPHAFVMGREHSVDIDDMEDMAVAEYYLELRNKQEAKKVF